MKHYRIFCSLAWFFVNKPLRTKLDPKSIRTYFVGYSSTSSAYGFWESVTDKIIESSNFVINESGKYCHSFPQDLGHEVYVNLPIDSIQHMTDHGIHFQLLIEIISSSHEIVGDSNSSGSWSKTLQPHDVLVHLEEAIPSADLPESTSEVFQKSLSVVEASLTHDIVAPSSIMEPDDVDEEPTDPRFRSIQELLNNTPRLPDYPNFSELLEELKPPDLFCIDPMVNNVIRFSDALLA